MENKKQEVTFEMLREDYAAEIAHLHDLKNEGNQEVERSVFDLDYDGDSAEMMTITEAINSWSLKLAEINNIISNPEENQEADVNNYTY